ncbi:hypothetical protein ADK67_35195 [Saccharothrix sp. NRRL B-16348]|uniref:DUF3224 domain-containing protein n=1 Tax=Saccharothrix sp. NRRL B-16348 TaxID=1415542 RepID=UPI0006C720A6|nr:DUF3224 domain-containing protein [Saccharothrix sp. NRRL B-16348]KOX18856.1 hypothetical protein ADK67_35195 [Saccharothrix sp. NRRL B-16348]
MTTHVTASADMKSWDEHTWDGKRYDEVTGPKQTTGGMTVAYTGDLEAVGDLRFVMSYPDDDSCVSTGYEVVTGTLKGRTGSFVLHHTGGFRDGVADATFTVVSATGDLAGLTGTGRITWAQGEPGRFELDYELS